MIVGVMIILGIYPILAMDLFRLYAPRMSKKIEFSHTRDNIIFGISKFFGKKMNRERNP